jgi:hypothetical protein
MAGSLDGFATVCFHVTGPRALADWQPGPLPIALPDGRITNAGLRSTYFQPLAAAALYGSPEQPCRWHRWIPALPGPGGRAKVHGVELLGVPQWVPSDDARTSFLAMVHLELAPDQPIAALAAAVGVAPGQNDSESWRKFIDVVLGSGFSVLPSWRRGMSTCFLNADGELPDLDDAPPEWTAQTAWLWLGASATPFHVFSPDLADPHLLDHTVFLSKTWRGLVLRDGVAFVGVSHSDTDREFLAHAAVYARTIYSDIMLLSILQRLGLEAFAGQLSRIGSRFEKSQELRALVNALTEYRNVLWWDDVARHGLANNLLQNMQAAWHTPELFERVSTDLEAFRQQVETQAAEMLTRSQEEEERRARRFNNFVAIASIAFALPLLVFTILLLPISGLTAEEHTYAWWQVLVVAIGTAALGALMGYLAQFTSRQTGHDDSVP